MDINKTPAQELNSYCEELPIINGVLYPDGNYDDMFIFTDKNQKRAVYHSNTRLQFPFSDNTVYSSIIIQSEIICNDLNCKAVCGEGSYGGDGFVMLESLTTGKMLWLVSFDNSNPFMSIQHYENTFIVTNNCNEKWHFDISDMDNIKISIN
ncbi:MAG: hypothetical protein K2J40_02785 [Ruminococcus sp.]|nr:hypothetical protein [Ruminococcus sp.]